MQKLKNNEARPKFTGSYIIKKAYNGVRSTQLLTSKRQFYNVNLFDENKQCHV